MPWPFLCHSEYLPLDRPAKVFCKFDDCFFPDVVPQKNGHIPCTNPKTEHPSDFASKSIAGHQFLSWLYSIIIGTIVKGQNLTYRSARLITQRQPSAAPCLWRRLQGLVGQTNSSCGMTTMSVSLITMSISSTVKSFFYLFFGSYPDILAGKLSAWPIRPAKTTSIRTFCPGKCPSMHYFTSYDWEGPEPVFFASPSSSKCPMKY